MYTHTHTCSIAMVFGLKILGARPVPEKKINKINRIKPWGPGLSQKN
jgi:hypothetical protein